MYVFCDATRPEFFLSREHFIVQTFGFDEQRKQEKRKEMKRFYE
jgi:hypothetical protein